jgi:hypothetical protein
LAVNSAAGLTPLEGSGIASQPTLSRFTAIMAEPANLKVLREAVLEMAGRGIRAERQGKRLPSVTLDVDSAPIKVHGHQPKAKWNGHYNGISMQLGHQITKRRPCNEQWQTAWIDAVCQDDTTKDISPIRDRNISSLKRFRIFCIISLGPDVGSAAVGENSRCEV